MKKVQKLFLNILISVLLFSSPGIAHTQNNNMWPAHLTIYTGATGGQWFSLGTSIASILNANLLPTASHVGGGVTNIKRLTNKHGDIGFTLACFMMNATSDTDKYKILGTENIRVIANVYPQILYFLVRKDFADEHNIKTIPDLLALKKTVRLASLNYGTASEFFLTMLFEHGYNADREKLKKQGWQFTFNNHTGISDDFVNGDLDCFVYMAGEDVPLIKNMEEYIDITILPIEENILSSLNEEFKTETYIIKPGTYNSITTPIKALSSVTTFIVHKDIPNTLVYEILNSIYKNKSAIVHDVADFAHLSADTAIPTCLPIHPGALKFWNDIKNND